jgi:hypothetical protein
MTGRMVVIADVFNITADTEETNQLITPKHGSHLPGSYGKI